MSFRSWRLTKDPVGTTWAVVSVLAIGAGVTVLGFALLAMVFG